MIRIYPGRMFLGESKSSCGEPSSRHLDIFLSPSGEEGELLDFTDIMVPMLVDDAQCLTLKQHEIVFFNMPADLMVYAGYDAGAGFFSGDFEVEFALMLDGITGGTACFCVFSNTLDEAMACDVANDGICVGAVNVGVANYRLGLMDFENDDSTLIAPALDFFVPYYCTFSRNDATQTMTLSIYTDPEKTLLVDSIVHPNINQSDYEYFYVLSCYMDGSANTTSGAIADMTVTPAIPPAL